MINIIKNQGDRFKKELEVPNMIKIPIDIRVSERLLVRKPLKPVDKENFNVRKLEKVMSMRLLKEYKQQARASTHSQSRVKIQDKKQFTFYSNHLDKISPLSSIIKQNRSKSNILEKIIDGRKTSGFKSISQKDLFL